MEKSQVEQMISTIRAEYDDRIKEATKGLVEERDNAIAALTLVEERLCSNVPHKEVVRDRPPVEPSAKKPITIDTKQMTKASRIRAALDRMQGDFEPQQWLDEVNNDGMGKKITRDDLAPYVTRMKGKQIEVIREYSGNTPGLYRKAKTQADPSPAVKQEGMF